MTRRILCIEDDPDIAELTRLLDALCHLSATDRLELLQLFGQLGEAFSGYGCFSCHLRSFT